MNMSALSALAFLPILTYLFFKLIKLQSLVVVRSNPDNTTPISSIRERIFLHSSFLGANSSFQLQDRDFNDIIKNKLLS